MSIAFDPLTLCILPFSEGDTLAYDGLDLIVNFGFELLMIDIVSEFVS